MLSTHLPAPEVQGLPSRAERRCRVAFVGGVQRIERSVLALAEGTGVDIEMHDGHTRGSGASRLKALVRRADLVIVVIGTNSHNAVHLTKREASRFGVPVRTLKTCGVEAARAAIEEFVRVRAA